MNRKLVFCLAVQLICLVAAITLLLVFIRIKSDVADMRRQTTKLNEQVEKMNSSRIFLHKGTQELLDNMNKMREKVD